MVRHHDNSASAIRRLIARSRRYNVQYTHGIRRRRTNTGRKLSEAEKEKRRVARTSKADYLKSKFEEVADFILARAEEMQAAYPRASKQHYLAELLQRSMMNNKHTREKATDWHAWVSSESTRLNNGAS